MHEKTVVLLRHARSLMNDMREGGFVKKEFQEKVKDEFCELSIPLSLEGAKVAEEVGKKLSLKFRKNLGEPAFDIAVHSGCIRTKGTLELAIEGAKKESRVLVKDHGAGRNTLENNMLMERWLGPGYFMTKTEYDQACMGADLVHRKTSYFAAPPGGKSRFDKERDVREFCYWVYDDERMHPKKWILAVTHGGFMMAFDRIAHDVPALQANALPDPKNCQAYLVKLVKGGPGQGIRIRDFQILNNDLEPVSSSKPK